MSISGRFSTKGSKINVGLTTKDKAFVEMLSND
jgi:hypothetical protein